MKASDFWSLLIAMCIYFIILGGQTTHHRNQIRSDIRALAVSDSIAHAELRALIIKSHPWVPADSVKGAQ